MIRRSLCWCLILLISSCSIALAHDRSEFLFLDEIEIGMQGVGRTIVAADVIDEFAVEVLGVIDQPGTFSDFIVVRVSGEAIGRAGGIAQGMSGSPVYVDGKLIGAISRSANWAKAITPIGLVTPIEPMLAVVDSARATPVGHAPTAGAVLADVRVVDTSFPPTPAVVAANPDTIFSYPVATPLIASGLSGRSLDLLMDGVTSAEIPQGLITDYLPTGIAPELRGLSSWNLSLLPMAASGAAGSIDPTSLEPGSSLGVALATGDVSLGAFGTVTYRADDTLVGFGHPFLANGASRFPLTTVSIIDTMKSLQASFKLGTLGDVIGTIVEDRTAGIAGLVGPEADWIDLSLGVHDRDRDLTQTYDIELIDEPHLMPELLLSTGFEAIDTTLDRIGPGTVEVSYQILGDGMPFPLERTDVFFSSVDIAVYPPWQLASIVVLLQYNAFEDPQITRIAASMQVTEEIRGIQVQHLEIDDWIYSPGDTIHFRIGLQTYRGEKRIEEGEIVIPDDLVSDYLFVRAYGGPRLLEAGESPQEFEDLGALIEAIETLPSYATLTVELFALDPFSPYLDALYGVSEVTFEYPGYVIYDEREVEAVLVESSETSAEEPSEEGKTGPAW